MSPKRDPLAAARATVAELERDAERVADLATAAEAAARDARTSPNLGGLAARAGGLRQAHTAILADLERERDQLAHLEADAERERDHAELAKLRERFAEVDRAAVDAYAAAVDAAVQHAQSIATLERDRAAAHDRMRALHQRLGLEKLRGPGEVRPDIALSKRPEYIPADEAIIRAVMGARFHPLVSDGVTRDEWLRASRKRRARIAVTDAQRLWDARADIVNRADRGAVHDPDEVAALRAWLADNPRPDPERSTA
jgi:hypothetical protein